MFRSAKFPVLCRFSVFFVLAGAQPAAAQVPDVGPGVCVNAPGMPCDGPSYSSRSSGSSGSSYSGPSARQRAALQHQQIMNTMMLNTMQGLMNNFMTGFQQGLEQNRQLRQQREQELMRQAQEEMAREQQRALAAQRAMERNRQQLQDARNRIAGAVRSMSAAETPMRPTLSVGETTGAFGTRVLKPRDMGLPVERDATEKAVCGQGLLNAAGSTAVSGSQGGLVASLKEAAFLSRQANHVVSGGQVDVACPPSEDAASSGPTEDMTLMTETIRQQSEVFSTLYDRIADNMERMTESHDMMKQDEAKISETRAIRDETAKTVEMLQTSMPSIQDAPADTAAAVQAELEAKQSALAEALAALRDSEQALADVQKSYEQHKAVIEDLGESMKSMEGLMKKALSDPQGVTELRSELGLPALPQGKQPG